MKDRGTPLPRCHKGPIRSAIAGAVGRLLENTLDGGVRPWDLPALQRRAATLGQVSLGTRGLCRRERVGRRAVARRRADPVPRRRRRAGCWCVSPTAHDTTLRPETTRRVELHGSATGIGAHRARRRQARRRRAGIPFRGSRPGRDGDQSTATSGPTAGRSILAEEVKNGDLRRRHTLFDVCAGGHHRRRRRSRAERAGRQRDPVTEG